MRLLENLREWSASTEEWSELCELQYKAEDLPAGPERDVARQRMAALLDSHAERMERSGLVRAFASSFTPQRLRAEAAEWRAGRVPAMSILWPLLDRDRYSDEEWSLSKAGLCDTVVEYGNNRGVIHCGRPADPKSFYRWCTEHDDEAREDYPSKYGR